MALVLATGTVWRTLMNCSYNREMVSIFNKSAPTRELICSRHSHCAPAFCCSSLCVQQQNQTGNNWSQTVHGTWQSGFFSQRRFRKFLFRNKLLCQHFRTGKTWASQDPASSQGFCFGIQNLVEMFLMSKNKTQKTQLRSKCFILAGDVAW